MCTGWFQCVSDAYTQNQNMFCSSKNNLYNIKGLYNNYLCYYYDLFWHFFFSNNEHTFLYPMIFHLLKSLYTFGTEFCFHRFTNNLQGLQKVPVKDFSWNIIPRNALLFDIKTISILDSENYGFLLNTCHDTAKRVETRVGFPVIFSRLRWPIDPKFSQVCVLYISCGTRSVGLGQYCLPNMYNGFNLN